MSTAPIYLPPEIIGKDLEHAVLCFGVWQALKLRTVSKMFDEALMSALSTTRGLGDDELLYEQDSRYPQRVRLFSFFPIVYINTSTPIWDCYR